MYTKVYEVQGLSKLEEKQAHDNLLPIVGSEI